MSKASTRLVHVSATLAVDEVGAVQLRRGRAGHSRHSRGTRQPKPPAQAHGTSMDCSTAQHGAAQHSAARCSAAQRSVAGRFIFCDNGALRQVQPPPSKPTPRLLLHASLLTTCCADSWNCSAGRSGYLFLRMVSTWVRVACTLQAGRRRGRGRPHRMRPELHVQAARHACMHACMAGRWAGALLSTHTAMQPHQEEGQEPWSRTGGMPGPMSTTAAIPTKSDSASPYTAAVVMAAALQGCTAWMGRESGGRSAQGSRARAVGAGAGAPEGTWRCSLGTLESHSHVLLRFMVGTSCSAFEAVRAGNSSSLASPSRRWQRPQLRAASHCAKAEACQCQLPHCRGPTLRSRRLAARPRRLPRPAALRS